MSQKAMLMIVAVAALAAAAHAAIPRSAELGLPHTTKVRTMPYIDNEEMIQKFDAEAMNRTVPTAYRFGIETPMDDLDVLADGTADQVEDGTVYRWRVDSKGAVLLQVAFSIVELQGGSMMYIYQSPEGDEVLPKEFAVYSNETHHMAEPRKCRRAVAPFVPAESAIVEVFVPTGGFADVKVHHVLHAFRDVLNFRANADNSANKIFGDSSSQPCENNAKCFPQYEDERRAASLITAGGGLCSGFMVNNVAGNTRMYMTASHCLQQSTGSSSGFISSNTVAFADFYFRGETFSCNNNNGPSSFSLPKLDGSTLLGNVPFNQGVDYAVLQLNQNPPNSFDLYYMGWESSNSACCGGTFGIHHPGGDYMKISIDNQQPTTGGFGGAFNQWEVRWNDGITAGGSSGSPLLRQSTRRVLGQLRGGSSFCFAQSSPDWYGKVSLGYNQGLDDILASGTSVTFMDGANTPGITVVSPPPPPPSPPPPPPPPPTSPSPPPASPDAFLFYGAVAATSGGGVSVPLLLSNSEKVSGIQFTVSGAVLTGGDSTNSDFTLSFNPANGAVLYFSLSGGFFEELQVSDPPQQILVLEFGAAALGATISITELVVSDNLANEVATVFAGLDNTVTLTPPPCGSGVEGDLNGDGVTSVLDVITLLNVIIADDTLDPPCLNALADFNDDGELNVVDVLSLVSLFV